MFSLRKISGIGYFINWVYSRLNTGNTEKIFTNYYRKNYWGHNESKSGGGSSLEQTAVLRTKLRELFDEFSIQTVLDVPCGDFNWMQHVELSDIDYTGMDIVTDVVSSNIDKYRTENIAFKVANLIESPLPQVDLVISRDCLVHFSYNDINKALTNITNSGSKFLLTTTFTDRNKNKDIHTGFWRPLNLQLAPFYFPNPLKIINESCSEGKGKNSDKSMALWRIADLKVNER